MSSILLLGNYRPTLTLARKLAPLGYRIIVTRGGGEGCSEFSRHVAECWDHPPLSDERHFFSKLNEFLLSRPDIKIVLPVWEACVEGLARHQHMLPQDRTYATPSPDTVEHCLNKLDMLKLASSVGAPCADFAVVCSLEELHTKAGRLELPVVVRPLASSLPIFGRKAVICRNRAEFEAAFTYWPEQHEQLIVQEYVEGPRYNVYFAARNGRPLRFLAAKILRTHLRDGTGLAVDGQTIDLDEDLKDATEKLLEGLNYTGVGCAQFIVDREIDRVTFLELNPRIAGNHAVAEASGLNLSSLAIDLARDAGVSEELQIAKGGKRYAWTYCDLRGLRVALQQRQISVGTGVREFCEAIWLGFRAPIHMTWDRRDPLPTIALFANQFPGLSKLVPTKHKRSNAKSNPSRSSMTHALAPTKKAAA